MNANETKSADEGAGPTAPTGNQTPSLRREIGLFGAMMLGLGSIVGTGVFVSIGIAAGVAGANVILAIFLASLLAICNGLSSAQLAALHPVSGGTYEYGYRWLGSRFGFSAGWLFLCAKSASAATAALGLATYLVTLLEWSPADGGWNLGLVALALAILLIVLMVVMIGIRRTSLINSVIVSMTLAALFCLVGVSVFDLQNARPENLAGWLDFSEGKSRGLLTATALMFVAYTGYGRIATLGEEVHEPRRTIPRAMIITLAVTMLLYLSVGWAAIATVGADELNHSVNSARGPLLYVAQRLNSPWLVVVLSIGAATAMLGVILNLLLGLSRVILAMARRGDMPVGLSQINSRGVPKSATLLVALIVGGLILLGDVRIAWSFSAFMVLVYYSITNLCALRVAKDQRLYPAWISLLGLAGCLFLALWIDPRICGVGIAVVLIGLVWHYLRTQARIDASTS